MLPHVTLYLAGFSVDRSDSSPVVLLPGSKFVVRGRLRSQARVHLGIRVTYHNGEFAGMFRGDLDDKQPLAARDENGCFEEVYSLQNFTVDPAVREPPGRTGRQAGWSNPGRRLGLHTHRRSTRTGNHRSRVDTT